MMVPLANGIYDGNLEIDNFIKYKSKKCRFENLIFKDLNEISFPVIKLKKNK